MEELKKFLEAKRQEKGFSARKVAKLIGWTREEYEALESFGIVPDFLWNTEKNALAFKHYALIGVFGLYTEEIAILRELLIDAYHKSHALANKPTDNPASGGEGM